MENFGKRLKELRTQHHLSQEELAKELGVTAQAVSKWEHGRSSPDFDAIVPMAKLFRISTDQLLGYEVVRQDWEYRWQRAMMSDDTAEARRIAAEAQREQQPMTGHFSYRQAESELVLARKTDDPAEKRKILAAVGHPERIPGVRGGGSDPGRRFAAAGAAAGGGDSVQRLP